MSETDQAPGAEDGSTQESRTRVCRRCSTQSTGTGDFCPQCGTSYERRRRRPSKRVTLVVAAVVCLLAAGGATAGVLVKQHNDDVAQAKAEKAARAAAAREEAREEAQRAEEERMRRERERRQALHDLEVEIRKESVKELRRSITKHAANLVVEGLLDGPILRTECDPTGGGNIDDTAAHTGNFSCMAVTEIDGDGTMSGYNYDGSINYDSGRYGWQLAN